VQSQCDQDLILSMRAWAIQPQELIIAINDKFYKEFVPRDEQRGGSVPILM